MINHIRGSRRPRIIPFVVGAGLAIAACSSAGTSTSGASKPASLRQAVSNTVSASSYSEVLSENTPQGKQTDYLRYQAPDRLGGYIQRGTKRTYVYVIGNTQYQSQAVPNSTPTKRLSFQSQASQGGAAALDPAHGYLPYATQASHPTHTGGTYSFTLTQQGQTGRFTYTVNGQYVSRFTLRVSSASVRVDISGVGTSPPVALPTGSKITSAPTAAP